MDCEGRAGLRRKGGGGGGGGGVPAAAAQKMFWKTCDWIVPNKLTPFTDPHRREVRRMKIS